MTTSEASQPNIHLSDLFDQEKLLHGFEQTALKVFYYQYEHNRVYRQYCDLLERNRPQRLDEIPFIPIETFKSHKHLCGEQDYAIRFNSSGTTGMNLSYHYVKDLSLYEKSFTEAFRYFYGEPSSYCVLALLPSYLERGGSSLVYMAEALIKQGSAGGGFFLNDHEALEQRLLELEAKGRKTLLIGVSYALLDFVEKRQMKLKHTRVMETGGMKGRKKEMPRAELHQILKEGLGVSAIHSEYGMTELLSQAYSKGEGIFKTPPWMKIMVRETNDPFAFVKDGTTGGLNIIDLANLHSCSFLQTQDLGKLHAQDRFEILGRFDSSDIRGCNLLVAE